MSSTNGRDMYWTGGPFRMSLQNPAITSPDRLRDALAMLEDFRAACQKQYIAFHGMINGRNLAHERFKKLMKSRDNTFFVGTAPPDAEQRLGHSCIAALSQGELLDGLATGREFETEHAKAFIVMTFSLWEGGYRRSLAKANSVQKKQVKCVLMNDIRQVRNCIVHDKAVVSDRFTDKLDLLSQVWTIAPGELRITDSMLHSLMEQINALRVEITTEPSPGTTK